MIQLARRATLLVAFCLLTSAATAYAECAWVLWAKQEWGMVSGKADKDGLVPLSEVPGTEWLRYSAYATQDACWAKITSLTFVPGEGSVTDSIGWLFGTNRYNDWTIHRTNNGATSPDGRVQYVCVRDTVDPRGPKGKRQ
jgi:hypothetical protein